jgi:murein DD-endopeptidase MepM/ murein hydrolase activator NlpD
MKLLSILICIAFCTSNFAQKNINIFNQKIDSGFVILANNNEIFPVSIKVDFNLKNLISTSATNIFVLPANANNYILTNLKIEEESKAYQFSLKYQSHIGDVTITKYDTNFEYELPFKTGNSFKLHQGYNGNFSHQNENALDFTMPIGTQVVAARSGVVIAVEDNNNENCSNPSCMQYNNYITILHNDGTYAKYAHIDFNGARVKLRDTVKQGTTIALSGNTGFSSGPHLHFVCYLPSIENKTTLETYFKINDGTKTVLLQEGTTYFKNY